MYLSWCSLNGHHVVVNFEHSGYCFAYLSVVHWDRYGPRAHGEEVMSMYGNSRAQGFGPEVRGNPRC